MKVDQPEDRGVLLRDVLDGVTDRQKGRCVLSSIGRTTTREYFTKDQGTMTFEPVRIPEYGASEKSRCLTASYAYKGSGEGSLASEAFPDNPNKQVRDYVAEPINIDGVYDLKSKETYIQYDLSGKNHNSQDQRAYYTHSKHGTLNASSTQSKTGVIEPVDVLYAIPVEFDGDIPTKAISCADGKTYSVYLIKDGHITIKGKQYSIKLADGFYIIRKLTVSECKRLQTVPEWYEFPVSDSQAYKMLGNGWTVEVIAHLINATQADVVEEEKQLSLFE